MLFISTKHSSSTYCARIPLLHIVRLPSSSPILPQHIVAFTSYLCDVHRPCLLCVSSVCLVEWHIFVILVTLFNGKMHFLRPSELPRLVCVTSHSSSTIIHPPPFGLCISFTSRCSPCTSSNGYAAKPSCSTSRWHFRPLCARFPNP